MAGLIAHEWVERSGGAERVLEELLIAFPGAELRVLWNDDPERFPSARETWIANTPLRRHKALAVPFMPATWRTFSAGQTPDWILASSHLFAHHARPRTTGSAAPKFSYVHTPARYIWEPELDARGQSSIVRGASGPLKKLDRRRAQESVGVAANSEFTRKRIQRAWDRDATVIYPPVDVGRIISGGDWRNHLSAQEVGLLGELPSEFLLGASRFVPYKRLDLVIDAGEATGLPVVLAGGGPGFADLEARAAVASVPVHFVGSPSNALLYSLYQASIAYVFPAIEDFGIMPVEAMAAGARVIASGTGGAAESIGVITGGITMDSFDPPAWRAAIDHLSAIDTHAARNRSNVFGAERFRSEIMDFVTVAPSSKEK